MKQQILVTLICLATTIMLDACTMTKTGTSGDSQRRDMRNRSHNKRDSRLNQMSTGAAQPVSVDGRA